MQSVAMKPRVAAGAAPVAMPRAVAFRAAPRLPASPRLPSGMQAAAKRGSLAASNKVGFWYLSTNYSSRPRCAA